MAKGLGRGLNAFFPEETGGNEDQITAVPVQELRPNPYQPRKQFEQEAIEELKHSVAEFGVLQPILVRKSIKGYDIVTGERRFRAASAAGLKEIPAIVKDLSDERMMEVALIENLQREDLNPLEEAHAYQRLVDSLGITQDELSKRLGKSRPHIANYIRLLQLPTEVQKLVETKEISMGHARTLLGLKKKELAVKVSEQIVKQALNVRQTEALVQQMNEGVPRETKQKQPASPFLEQKAEELQSYFGTSVSIQQGKNKGKIEIEFFSDEDLDRILQLLSEEKE